MENEKLTSYRSIRALALSALVCYGLTVVLGILTLEFRTLGAPQAEYFIYIPPQGYLTLLTGLLLLLLDLVVGLSCAASGFARRSSAWPLPFLLLLAMAFCGPGLIVVQLSDSSIVNLSQDAVTTVLLVSAAGSLLIPLLALLYARRLARIAEGT